MASKTKATRPQHKERDVKEETPEKEAADAPDTPLPLLDLSDAAVKKLIRTAKKRGYVTHDQINAVLPSEEVNSEQIEDVLAMFSEMGVNVVETEEASDDEEKEGEEEEPESRGRRAGRSPAEGSRPRPRPRSRPSAPTIRCACICARWARWSCSRARAKSPSPSASRPAARR